MVGFAGVSAMLVSVAGVMVSRVLPLTAPRVAEMVLVPAATACASPAVLIVATDGVAEVGRAAGRERAEISVVAVSLKENCLSVPFAIVGFAGVTAMLVSVAGV